MFKKSVQLLWPPPVSIPTEYVRFKKVWLWFILANAGTWFTNMNMLFQLGKNMNKGRENTKTTQKASEKNNLNNLNQGSQHVLRKPGTCSQSTNLFLFHSPRQADFRDPLVLHFLSPDNWELGVQKWELGPQFYGTSQWENPWKVWQIMVEVCGIDQIARVCPTF